MGPNLKELQAYAAKKEKEKQALEKIMKEEALKPKPAAEPEKKEEKPKQVIQDDTGRLRDEKGIVKDHFFNKWRVVDVRSEIDAKRALAEKNVEYYWDMVMSYKYPEQTERCGHHHSLPCFHHVHFQHTLLLVSLPLLLIFKLHKHPLRRSYQP
eukprot:TRINITY_DN4017_c0_g1_i6.p2 TRINITY_DN4017_c0_g1~~TRINITY_DN4017_c0_g1_i6.p2  ORF type:complete len:154 (-),score=32.82 TRINITY_DN4017_c0_g1_i6:240-701(-)